MIKITSDTFGTDAPTFTNEAELHAHVYWCATELNWYGEYRDDAIETCRGLDEREPVAGEDYQTLEQWCDDFAKRALSESEVVLVPWRSVTIWAADGSIVTDDCEQALLMRHYRDNSELNGYWLADPAEYGNDGSPLSGYGPDLCGAGPDLDQIDWTGLPNA